MENYHVGVESFWHLAAIGIVIVGIALLVLRRAPDSEFGTTEFEGGLRLQGLLGQGGCQTTLRRLCASHVGQMSSLWLPMIGDVKCRAGGSRSLGSVLSP